MNNFLILTLAMIAGLLLGVVFFGGLWWTIRKGLSSKHPAAWFLGSLLLRMSLTLFGFYWVGHGHWERLVVCLGGFFVARLIVTWLSRQLESKQIRTTHEANHAP